MTNQLGSELELKEENDYYNRKLLQRIADREELESHLRRVIELLGYDPEDQHFKRTPIRVAQVVRLFESHGSFEEADATAGKLLVVQFVDVIDSMVVVGTITFRCMCAHHFLTVLCKAWVGYILDGRVCGLSMLARVVHFYAQQFTVQERVTQQIANLINDCLQPLGVGVIVQAVHGCMSHRGVMEPDAETSTSAVRGVFLKEPGVREEFMRLSKGL